MITSYLSFLSCSVHQFYVLFFHSLGRGSEKLKRGWKYDTGTGLLKGGRGGWHFSYLIFSRFIIFIFRNYFTLYKIVLCFWRKIIFCHHNFMKKGHSKLSKNETEIKNLNKDNLSVKGFICNCYLIENDGWTGKITLLIFV